MIVIEDFNEQYKHIYSDERYFIEKSGSKALYIDALDTEEEAKKYKETDKKIETDEKIEEVQDETVY